MLKNCNILKSLSSLMFNVSNHIPCMTKRDQEGSERLTFVQDWKKEKILAMEIQVRYCFVPKTVICSKALYNKYNHSFQNIYKSTKF